MRHALWLTLISLCACVRMDEPAACGPDTPCAVGLVCDSDRCVPCAAGEACALGGEACHLGVLSCERGRHVCNDSGQPAPDGTACAPQRTCLGGRCGAAATCQAGGACAPVDRCHQGVFTCVAGQQVCRDTGVPIAGDAACALLAYWPLDGSGEDRAGGRALTLFGGPAFAAGLLGQALDLRRTRSQYAARPVNDEIFDLADTEFTIQAWLSFHDLRGEQTFFEKIEGPLPPAWTLTKNDAQRLVFHGAAILISGAINPALESWHQVVLRRDAREFTLFFDANRQAAAPVQPMGRARVPLLIGKRVDADGRDFSFNGRIDELAIWRRALRDDEIGRLYNGGQGLRAAELH